MSFRVVVYQVKPPVDGQRVERLVEKYRQDFDELSILQVANALNRKPRVRKAKAPAQGAQA